MSRLSSTRLVVLSAWASRLTSALVSLYSLRVLSRSLSEPEYATYIVLIGLIGWYALGDLGLGFATQNAVTRKLALGEDPAGSILGAYALLAVATLLIGACTVGVSDRLSHALLGKISGQPADLQAFRVAWSGLILLSIATAGLANKLLYAVHKGYVANGVTAAAALLGFAILTSGLPTGIDPVIFAVAALYGPTVAISLGIALAQVRKALVRERPVRRIEVLELLQSARGFLLFSLMAAAVLQVDYIIMAQKIAPIEIIQYFNLARLFGFIAFFNQAIMFASWPRFTEQFAQRRFAEVTGSIQRLIVYGALISTAASALILWRSDDLSDFLSPSAPIDFRAPVIAGFAAIALARCVTDPYAIFLQSTGRLQPLIVFAAVQAVVGGTLQWLLAGVFGIEGILLAVAASFLLTVAWGLPYSARRHLRAQAATA